MDDYLNETQKPRHEFFYDLIRDTHKALTNLKIIRVQTHGLDALFRILKQNHIKLVHGSLRFDRDARGMVFMQEFRPGKGLLQRGYFHSIDTDRPLWEIVASAIIRLAGHRERIVQKDSSELIEEDYCIILQGNMEMKYILSLVSEGRVSFDTKQEHLKEEPIYYALAILSKLQPDQVLQMKIKDTRNAQSELTTGLFKIGRTAKDIACLLGKTVQGEYYATPGAQKNTLPVNMFNHKVVPIEIARELKKSARALMREKKVLVLDNLTFSELSSCLLEREKFYYEISKTP